MPQFAPCSNPKMILYIAHGTAVYKLASTMPSQTTCTILSYTSLMLMGTHLVPSLLYTTHAPSRSWQLTGQHCSLLLPGTMSPGSICYKQQPLTFTQGKQGINRNSVCVTRVLRGICFCYRQAEGCTTISIFQNLETTKTYKTSCDEYVKALIKKYVGIICL